MFVPRLYSRKRSPHERRDTRITRLRLRKSPVKQHADVRSGPFQLVIEPFVLNLDTQVADRAVREVQCLVEGEYTGGCGCGEEDFDVNEGGLVVGVPWRAVWV